jgi:NAD(P)-dependent dehydrogenase (short-subunit alcohol dehydrogenase family)
LIDKVAIVTGGGSGIGRAIAEAFAHEGADVAVAEIDPETGTAAAAAIEALGQKALFIQVDVAEKSHVDAMVAQVIEKWGRIDVLVNNAGIHETVPFLDVSEDLFDRTLATNLKSQFFCAQAVARHMAKRGKGKIINTSSVSEEIADPGASHYCIGKGGTRMLTRSAALELAEYNIQVNSLSPGTIKTALPWYDTPDAQEYLEKFVPAGRFGLPQDVAGAAVFLASDDSDYVTGTTIVIDGGLTTQ